MTALSQKILVMAIYEVLTAVLLNFHSICDVMQSK